jgi:redox-sensing transcriptional repressor
VARRAGVYSSTVEDNAAVIESLANPSAHIVSASSDKPAEPAPDGQVPKAVVSRLSLYLRELQHLVRDGHETTSSTQLGKLLGFTDAQVRKDLAYFGQFGYPGIGYRCAELIDAIKRILGTNQPWPLAIVGLGNLGRALMGYRGFQSQGFRIVAAFDVDPAKIGTQVDGIPIYHLNDVERIVREHSIRLAIIAVPAVAAQSVADQVVQAGVEGVLNFAPVTISLPKEISSVGVDLAIELEQLSFAVASKPK